MQAITATLIVKNEAARLRPCLAALIPAVDEIVVADTGSADDSKAIAMAVGAHCFDFPWCDDFAAARNAALDRATHEWVLVVDADEVLRDGERTGQVLRCFADAHGRDTLGTVEIVSPTAPGADAAVVMDHMVRFFHRGSVRYEGRIHEQPVHVAANARSAPTGAVFDHSGYALSPAEAERKALRNLVLLEQTLCEHPDDEYFHFQSGKAYQTLGRHGEAAAAFRRGLDAIHFPPGGTPTGRLGPVGRSVLTGLVTGLAYGLVNTNRLPEAARLLEEHAGMGHAGVLRADFDYVRGYVYLMLGNLTAARAAYEASLRRGAAAEDVQGTGTYASAYHLGLLAEAGEDLVAAYNHYLLSLSFKPDYRQTLLRCVDLTAEQGIALPEEVARAGCLEALSRIYRERLEHYLSQGNMEAVTRLAHGVSACPALIDTCREILRAHA